MAGIATVPGTLSRTARTMAGDTPTLPDKEMLP